MAPHGGLLHAAGTPRAGGLGPPPTVQRRQQEPLCRESEVGCENVSPPSPPKGRLQVLQVGPEAEGVPPALRHTHPEGSLENRGRGQGEGCGQSAEATASTATGRGPERS